MGSLFYVKSEAAEIVGKSITTVHHLMTMDGEVAASDSVKSVYFDLAQRKPSRCLKRYGRPVGEIECERLHAKT